MAIRNNNSGKLVGGLVLLVGVVAVAAVLNPFVIIGPGERGVLLNFGAVQNDVLGEGLHVRMPLRQRIEIMNVQVQKDQTDAAAASADLQDTMSTVALNYHVLPDKAGVVYQQLGQSYAERVISPQIQETVKAVTAQYTAVDLITQREKVRRQIADLLRERLTKYNIIVDDLSIVDFKFSPQFAQAIEAKQTAEQLALKAERDLERIKVEAEQKVTQAKAEAESLQLQKEAVTDELLKLRQIEVSQAAVAKWDGHLPNVTGGALPFLNIGELGKEGK